MAKEFSTKYLVSVNDGQHTLRSYSGKVIPGSPFDHGSDENMLLAGGFPSLFPESTALLSPTLKINDDLGVFTENELHSIANAELARQQTIGFHSYLIDPDLRICVVADDAADVDRFIEIYGGLLEIEAILLQNSHPEYTAAMEIRCDASNSGCRLDYRKRAPLRFERCSYCGECGPTCPEKCIAADLFIDFNQCTLCKECEKACPHDAIDIAGMEEVTVHAPAVVLLGAAEVETTGEGGSIYREEHLEKYLKALYSAEIKEVVCHNNTICQYSGRLDTGCARCVVSCPQNALTKGEKGIAVDHIRCVECGNCVAVCPTGAMQNEYFDDEALFSYLSNLKSEPGRDLVIGSEEDLLGFWWENQKKHIDAVFFLEHPAKTFLSFFHFLLLFSVGFRRVKVLSGDVAAESALLQGEVNKANTIVSSLFNTTFVEFVSSSDVIQPAVHDLQHPLQRFIQPDTQNSTRRAALSQVILHLLSQSEKSLQGDSIAEDFHAIVCDAESCTHCLACLNECKTNALQADSKKLALTYLAGLCVGCGVCVEVCPENVLAMADNTIVTEAYFQRQTLAQAEPAQCQECGKVFGTRKSLERVMQILTSKGSVDLEHFELCSDCKVVKIFEAQEI